MANNNDSFCRIPVSLIQRYGKEIPFDLYLRLSENKIVKISNKDEDILEVYEKYKSKGVTDIFARREDYSDFLRRLKEGLNTKLFDPSTTPVEKQAELLSDSLEVVKEAVKKLGISKEAIGVARTVSNASLKMIQQQPNIFDFFKQFQERCSKEYMRSVLVGYVSTCMLDYFDWQSTTIKEKANLAAMLRDIVLSPADFNEIEIAESNENFDELSKIAYNHPLMAVRLLSEGKGQNSVAQEVLTIIEQHHERPKGDGFPKKVNHQRITQLSAIHIVADAFIRQMIKEHFDFAARDRILYFLNERYSQGNFRKALEALHKVLDIPA